MMTRGSIISGIVPEGRSLIISIATAMIAVAAVIEHYWTCYPTLIMSISYPLVPSFQYFRRIGVRNPGLKGHETLVDFFFFFDAQFAVKDTGK